MPPIWIFLHTVSEDFGDEGVSPVITEQTCCSVWLRGWGCYSLDQPGPDFVAGRLLSVVKGAPINDKEEVEGGEKCSELVMGKASCWVSFKIQARSFSGWEKAPRFLQTVNSLWLHVIQRDGVQVMTVWFWQTPPSCSYSTLLAAPPFDLGELLLWRLYYLIGALLLRRGAYYLISKEPIDC